MNDCEDEFFALLKPTTDAQVEQQWIENALVAAMERVELRAAFIASPLFQKSSPENQAAILLEFDKLFSTHVFLVHDKAFR